MAMGMRNGLLAIFTAIELVAAGITIYEFVKQNEKRIPALIFTILFLIPLIYLIQYNPEIIDNKGSAGTVSNSATVNIYCYDEENSLIKHETMTIYSSQNINPPTIKGYEKLSSSVQVSFNKSSGYANPDAISFYYKNERSGSASGSITAPPVGPVINTYYFSSSVLEFPSKLKKDVYTGPGTNYYRANNGKAGFDSKEFKYGGRIGNWLFVRCSVTGGIRYGWIDVGEYQNTIQYVPTLQFSDAKATVRYQTAIWDSMMDFDLGPLTYLSSGTQVTHLCDFVIEGTTYAYVATTISGRQAYGFVYSSDIQ